MFYHSKKKKIRGWKRQKRKIEKWKQQAMDLDMDYVRDYERAYVKLWIHPFYALLRWNPPAWYKRLLLEAMMDVYFAWHQKMKKEHEDFYLKIWLYDPHFLSSQIVVAYKDCLNFYDETFRKRKKDKEFPYDKFYSVKDKLEQFEWDLCIDTDYYDEMDLHEGSLSKKEVQAIKEKAYDVATIRGEKEAYLQYRIDKGDVWVGTIKM